MPSLAPLKDGDAAAQSGDAAAGTSPSFRERKLSQLQGESEPEPGKPPATAESAEDGYPDDDQYEGAEITDDEDDADFDGDPQEAALNNESTDDLEAGEDEDEEEELTAAEWQEKAENLQRELSRVTENRKKIEADFRNSTAENITYRHQLEDSVEQVKQHGAFWMNLAQGQVKQFETLDWSRVPPEQMGEMRARAQKAVQHRDQILQHLQGIEQRTQQSVEESKQRQAELSRNVLMSRIDGWDNELYGKVREHAAKFHFTPEEAGEILDWRIIEMIHRDMEREQAVQTVQKVKRKRKARVPGTKSQKRPDRSANGRFQNAKAAAHANPGDKGKFREMQMQKLNRERNAGR